MDLTTVISIIAVLIAVLTFFFNRKDKSNSEVKEEIGEQTLIKYRLDELDRKVDKILDKLEIQENETRKIIDEELEKHVLKYHKGE